MKKIVLFLLYALKVVPMQNNLPESPSTIEQFIEIATQYSKSLPEFFNNLTTQEKIFVYYMFRASLPGNIIASDQMHRHSNAMITMAEELVLNEHLLRESDQWLSRDLHNQFFEQLKTYLIYLWGNHGPYFAKEHSNEKRTPAKLNLSLISQDILIKCLEVLNKQETIHAFKEISDCLFNADLEHTNCIANNIESSGVNFYSADFTEEDFQALSATDKTHLNAYYYIQYNEGERIPSVERYKIGGKYSKELAVSQFWLLKALEHARMYPEQFDNHLIESLEHLIRFLQTGDEADFRKHSIAWLKTNNRIDYVFGFIETYQDPKEFRGLFQAEITIKTINMQKLNELLPICEQKLPFKDEFKRENLGNGASMPNASINTKIFASGGTGPLEVVAAYCLPNYEDIRSQHGSKQVIYQSEKGLGSTLNPQLYKKLFYLSEHVDFLTQHDPQGQLHSDIWNVHCILHETLGHGSGRLAYHTFVAEDNLTIDGKTYAVGDTLLLTPDNSTQFFEGSAQSLEELRAEIIALYTSIFMFDELAAGGLYKDWPEKIGKEKLIEWLIYDMAGTGLRRLQSQPADKKEITGAHAQANTIIMNYLLDSGALLLEQEKKVIEDKEYTVLGFKIVDLNKICETIKELAIIVQTIKSTADGIGFKKLLNDYGLFVRNPEFVTILQNNMKAVVGNLKVAALIYPRLEPVFNSQGIIEDIKASWPSSFVEQRLEFKKIALSTQERELLVGQPTSAIAQPSII